MSILHMGLILMSVGATIYVAATLLQLFDGVDNKLKRELEFRKKHEKEYVFYAADKDRILVRRCLPSECAKMVEDTPHLSVLGEL